MTATLAFQYPVDQPDRNPKSSRNLAKGKPRFPKGKYFRDIFVFQLCGGVSFADRRAASIRILSSRIFLPTDPLKIASRIVQLVSVKMVDGQIIGEPLLKRLCNQSVDKEFAAPSIALDGYNQIAALAYVWAKQKAFAFLRRLPIPPAWADVRERAYITIDRCFGHPVEGGNCAPFGHGQSLTDILQKVKRRADA